MIPIELEEPDLEDSFVVHSNEVSIGIDFGTTNSLAFISSKDKTEPVFFNGKILLPSIISISQNHEISIGEVKKDSINIKSIKTLIGVKQINADDYDYDIEVSDTVYIHAFGKKYDIVFLCSKIINHMLVQAKKQSSFEITKTVITVPAYFDEHQRQVVKSACNLCGLDVLRIINEPTSAIIAYNLENQNDGIYAVYDLGGGTFDVSIVKVKDAVIQVLSSKGSLFLGGDDFDKKIVNKIKIQSQKCINCSNFQNSLCKNNTYLLEIAKQIKHELGEQNTVSKNIDVNGKSFKFLITAEEFQNDCEDLVQKTFLILGEAIKDAKLTIKDVSSVILVGGSTKMDFLKEKIRNTFSKPIMQDQNPEEIVAHGAGIKAKELTFGSDSVLIDINTLSIGIETLGGKFEPIIQKNTTIPCIAQETFSTFYDNQSSILINIYQGDRPFVKDCRLINSFAIKDIPLMKAKEPRIKITLQIDLDGLLTVNAIEEKTNTKQKIEVKPLHKITFEDILEIKKNAQDNVINDEQDLIIFDSNHRAKELLSYVKKALEDERVAFGDSFNVISESYQNLSSMIDKNTDLTSQCDEFEKLITPFFEKIAGGYFLKYVKNLSQQA